MRATGCYFARPDPVSLSVLARPDPRPLSDPVSVLVSFYFGYIPPGEAEANYYRQLTLQPVADLST